MFYPFYKHVYASVSRNTISYIAYPYLFISLSDVLEIVGIRIWKRTLVQTSTKIVSYSVRFAKAYFVYLTIEFEHVSRLLSWGKSEPVKTLSHFFFISCLNIRKRFGFSGYKLFISSCVGKFYSFVKVHKTRWNFQLELHRWDPMGCWTAAHGIYSLSDSIFPLLLLEHFKTLSRFKLNIE